MTKDYYVEIKLKPKRWVLVKTFKRHSDALDHIRENVGERYPMRIVKVVRTIVFGEDK